MIPIDVIIANYNNAKFLPQCLESVLNQTLLPKEIIVIDDASTDDSLLVLEPYVRENKITLIKNNENLGVTASRNRAIAHGGSAFITTLDADDFYQNSGKLAAEANVIQNSGKHSIAFSDIMRVDKNGQALWLISSKRKLQEGDLSFDISHLRGFIPRDYLVSRDDFLNAGGYNPKLKIYEDWDLKIRLAKRCNWCFSNTIGTAYRDNPKGLSRSPLREHIIAMRRIFLANCHESRTVFRVIYFARFFFYHSLYLRRFAI